MTFANRTARVLGPYYEGEVPLGSIQILRQPKDWMGGLKNCFFAVIQYCIYTVIMGGLERVQKYVDVIYGWSLRRHPSKISPGML